MRTFDGPASLVAAELLPTEILRSRVIPSNVAGFPIHVEERVGPLNPKACDVVVRAVCRPCNNGWLSRLESSVKPIVRRLVAGDDVSLSPADQEALARWIIKTAMLYTLWYPHQELFSESHFAALYRDLAFPEHTVAYVGRSTAPEAVMALAWQPMSGAWLPAAASEADWRGAMLAVQTARPVRASVYLGVAGLVFLVHFDLLKHAAALELPVDLARHWLELVPTQAPDARLPDPMSSSVLGRSRDALASNLPLSTGSYGVVNLDDDSNGAVDQLLADFRSGRYD